LLRTDYIILYIKPYGQPNDLLVYIFKGDWTCDFELYAQIKLQL